ncbi:hypothetical protein D3C80_927450 [compost metagenome]
MPQEAHPAEVMPIQAVIVPPAAQGRPGHVQVQHMLGATGDGGHREAAGVGEQIEHPLAPRMLPHPVAAVAHVEEQAVVLFLAQVELEAQSAFADHALVHRFAPDQLDGAFQQVTVLQQQALRLAATPGRRVCQGHEHGLQCGQFGFARFAEQGHQQYALEPVGGDLFEPRPALPAAMEQAADLVWRVVQGGGQLPFESGDGVEVHGGGHGCGARILPLFASANSQVA